MPVPRIAIVGRPNVGKSSLLNMVARDKVSIVDNTPGTTRDRVSVLIELTPPNEGADSPRKLTAELTDTGGFGVYVAEGRRYNEVGADLATLTNDIEFQISQAVASADLVLFVIDAQAGVTAADEEIARMLRERVLGAGRGRKGRDRAAGAGEQGQERDIPVLVIANKVDGPRWEAHAIDAAALGLGEPVPVSAKNNYFRRDFLDALYEAVAALPGAAPGGREEAAPSPEMKLAIIGKRNAGKSSLVNALAGEKRVIVSEIAGTTRDAVDVRFEMDGHAFLAIDTAGLRKKKSFADRIEWFAFDRVQRSIERADVVLLLVDATEPPSQVDQQLGWLVQKSHKPVVIVVNKWDLVEGRPAKGGKHAGRPVTPEVYEEYLRKEFKGLDFAPISFISAEAGTNIRETVQLAFELYGQASARASTGKLNRLLKRILEMRGPSSKLGTFAKTYFIAQVATNPPTIVIVVNRPELFTPNYQRFLLNALREELPYPEVPIKLVVKERKRARLEDLAAGKRQEEREAAGIYDESEFEEELSEAAAEAASPAAGAPAEDGPDADLDELPGEAEAYFDDDGEFRPG